MNFICDTQPAITNDTSNHNNNKGNNHDSTGNSHTDTDTDTLKKRWVGEAPPLLDSVILNDTHLFSLCDDACVISHDLENVTLTQGAPARVTRNGLPLPLVAVPESVNALSASEPPFVVATRYPNNGPVSVSTIGRTLANVGWVEPRADVTLLLTAESANTTTFGVFGYYHSLTIAFPKGGTGSTGVGADAETRKVLAQDLAGDHAVDISAKVHWESGTASASAKDNANENAAKSESDDSSDVVKLVIPGSVVEEVGLMAKSRADDASSPGLVLVLETPAK